MAADTDPSLSVVATTRLMERKEYRRVCEVERDGVGTLQQGWSLILAVSKLMAFLHRLG